MQQHGAGPCIINEGQILYPVYKEKGGSSYLASVLPLHYFHPHAERAACPWLSIDPKNLANTRLWRVEQQWCILKRLHLRGCIMTSMGSCWQTPEHEGENGRQSSYVCGYGQVWLFIHEVVRSPGLLPSCSPNICPARSLSSSFSLGRSPEDMRPSGQALRRGARSHGVRDKHCSNVSSALPIC